MNLYHQSSLATAWFDDLKIEKVEKEQLENEIVEESNYYPSRLKHKGYNNVVSSLGNATAQKFGFGGKENNEELGLDWMDFGARNYDASLGRWMNLDPLAERMRRHSPYNYAFDNPIYFIDPDGMMPFGPGEMDKDKNYDNFRKSQAPLEDYQKKGSDNPFGFTPNWIGVEAGNSGGNGGGTDPSPSTTLTSTHGGLSMTLGGGEQNASGVSSGLISSALGIDYKLYGLGNSLVSVGANYLSRNATITNTILTDVGKWTIRNKFWTNSLGNVSNFSRNLGFLGAGLGTISNLTKLYDGNMSFGRFTFNLAGTGAGFYGASAYGGPFGVFVGGVSYLGNLMYKAAEISNKQRIEAATSSPTRIKNTNIFSKAFWTEVGGHINSSSFFHGFSY